MAVVIVGRVDPAKLSAKITEIFGSMAAATESVAPYTETESPRPTGFKPAVLVIPDGHHRSRRGF